MDRGQREHRRRLGYDSHTSAGTDSSILAGTWHDFANTPDDSDVTATVSVFYRAA
jgi:hypothetical protein